MEEIAVGLSPLTYPFIQSTFTTSFLGARHRPWGCKGEKPVYSSWNTLSMEGRDE